MNGDAEASAPYFWGVIAVGCGVKFWMSRSAFYIVSTAAHGDVSVMQNVPDAAKVDAFFAGLRAARRMTIRRQVLAELSIEGAVLSPSAAVSLKTEGILTASEVQRFVACDHRTGEPDAEEAVEDEPVH